MKTLRNDEKESGQPLWDFKNRFESTKVLMRLDWNRSIKFEGEKVLMRSKAVSEAVSRGAFSGAKLSLFRYFLLLLLETILGFRVYMVMGFQFLNQILMRQVSSHR